LQKAKTGAEGQCAATYEQKDGFGYLKNAIEGLAVNTGCDDEDGEDEKSHGVSAKNLSSDLARIPKLEI
jgi:hypothetical protein